MKCASVSLVIIYFWWNQSLERQEEAGCEGNAGTLRSAGLRKFKNVSSVNVGHFTCEGTRMEPSLFQAISSFLHHPGVPQGFAVAL